LPEAPRSKRAVPAARPVAKRHPAPAVVPPDPTPSKRRGFRVPALVPAPATAPEDDAEVPGTNYALRLTEALEAISSAQNLVHPSHRGAPSPGDAQDTQPASYGGAAIQRSLQGTTSLPRAQATQPPGTSSGSRGQAALPRHPPGTSTGGRGDPAAQREPDGARETRTKASGQRRDTPKSSSAFARLAASFSNLPPIRLPIGPPIPWRFGAPALVLLVVVMIFVARPISQADSRVARLPTPETYPVQQEAPLFTDAQPTPPPTAPLGVTDPGGVGFDVFDVGLKLIAVLALAYASLLLLKKTGMGGVAAMKTAGKSSGLQVVASLTLAPNRTVHLLKVPGGKTVLVGATPNQVNLIVDLGDVSEDVEAEAPGSFFDILKGKLPQ